MLMSDKIARELLAALNAMFDTVADEQVVHQQSGPTSFSETSALAADEARSGGKLALAICVAMAKVQTRIV